MRIIFNSLMIFGLLSIPVLKAQTVPDLTPEGANVFLTDKCYWALKYPSQEYNFYEFPILAANILSDDAHCGGESINDMVDHHALDTFTVNSANKVALGLWNKFYNGINYCNMLLDLTKDGGSSLTDIYRAEAKFLRAYNYFQVVNFFGDAPLITTIDIPVLPNQARNTKTELYTQIETDLKDAISDLPLKSARTADEKERASKGSAQALLGKVYLYQQKYSDAILILEELKNSGEYTLLANYENLFRVTNKCGPENIFELNYPNVASKGYYMNIFCGPRASSMIDSSHNLGWGFCQPSVNLVNSFKSQNDTVRLKATAISSDSLKKLHDIFTGTPQYLNFTGAISGYWNNKLMPDPHYALDIRYQHNLVVLRLADVYLMLAEAYSKTANDASAQINLNIVRSRANLAPVTFTGNTLFEAIKHERRLELALEGERYFDLLRWGDADSKLSIVGYSNTSGPGISTNGLLPVPLAEISKNPKLTQNAGYSTFPIDNTFTPAYEQSSYNDLYKNGLDSTIRYQYNYVLTDSVLYAKNEFRKTGNVLNIKYSEWDIANKKWIESSWSIDTINLQGKILSSTQFRYNFTKSKPGSPYWDTLTYEAYTYNSNGVNTSYMRCTWGRIKYNGVYVYKWTPNFRFLHFPDNKGNDTLYLDEGYSSSDNKFHRMNKLRYNLVYDVNGLITESTSMTANYSSDSTLFTNSNKITYKYDDKKNPVEQLNYYWVDPDWVYNYGFKTVYEYDNNGNIISKASQYPDIENVYINESKEVYVLDKNKNIIVNSAFKWDYAFNDWWITNNKFRRYYYYSPTTVINNLSVEKSDLALYPNPANDKVFVKYNLQKANNVEIQILSIDRKAVKYIYQTNQRAGDYSKSINVSNLNSGIYVLKFSAGNDKITRKLSIIK